MQRLGYDLKRGRQNISRHPFCAPFAPGDVRITTRVRDTLRDSCLFSSIHESGHAMYEQGVAPELDRTPLCEGASSGVHESQSRLWENYIGRSSPFWQHFYPKLQKAFPEVLNNVRNEEFYAAVNRVRPSYIRVDSDEVTYNLYIVLRTELENQLLAGDLAVNDLPEAWNNKLQEYLGLDAPSDADGCLQDIHLTFPEMGSFVGYSLGNLIAAQVMEKVRQELPELDQQIAQDHFAPLLEWLQANLYRHGRKFTPPELVKKITGEDISTEPWKRYIDRKYRSLYEI